MPAGHSHTAVWVCQYAFGQTHHEALMLLLLLLLLLASLTGAQK
jgi:hypothetical protein